LSDKPEKTLYENQAEVWDSAKRFLTDLIADKPVVQEALVWASLAEGKFGLYAHDHKGQEGSDIDLVIIVDEGAQIPEEWKFTTIRKSCFDLYRLGTFVHEGHKHLIDGLLVFPSRHDLQEVRDMLADRSKSIYIKSGESTLKTYIPTK
jgi:hypothetical protein